MVDEALDVIRLRTAKVTLEVPFHPAGTPEAAAEASPEGLVLHTFRFREQPAAHVIEYMDLINSAARTAFVQPAPACDFLQGLQDSLAGARQQIQSSQRLLRHITGLEDESFLAALTPAQQDALIEAYESVNPSMGEMKKKLDQMFLAATAQMASHATERMLQEHGLVPPIAVATVTDSTPTLS